MGVPVPSHKRGERVSSILQSAYEMHFSTNSCWLLSPSRSKLSSAVTVAAKINAIHS